MGEDMKKILVIVIFFVVFFIIFGILMEPSENVVEDKNEKRGVFVSYIELSRYLKGKDEVTSKRCIDEIIQDAKDFGLNMIILQVRSFSDAIYDSKIFPWSSTVSDEEGVSPGYDVLDYFIRKAHKEKMFLYAWINPYRVRTNSDINSISVANPAHKYINTDTLFVGKGIFYNPAKPEVEDLIVDGVLEIISNYKVDGVLFDDYFYPDPDIDLNEYQKYLEKNPGISKEDYHLMIVNKMVKRVHQVCKKKGVPFGISPDGNISNNYEKLFADVKRWVSSDKYVDFIMPQIYYGFFNEAKAFHSVSLEWDKMITNSKIKLYVALAFYKVGTVDPYAKSGEFEWVGASDIIMREIILSRNLKHYDGFSLFRYDNIFNSELYTKNSFSEIENVKKILK